MLSPNIRDLPLKYTLNPRYLSHYQKPQKKSNTINVHFSRKNISHPNVKFGNSSPTIELSHNHTHLGLNFKSDAGWKVRIQTAYEKACNRLNILRMLKHSLCREALIKIYMSFIGPI